MRFVATTAAALLMGACAGSEPRSGPRPIASAADPSALKPQEAAAEKPAPIPAAGSQELPPPPRELKPIPAEPGKKFEIVDLHVDTRNPKDMQRLVPFLLRSEEWMILKVEWTSATGRHYRFQRVAPPKDAPVVPGPLAPRSGS